MVELLKYGGDPTVVVPRRSACCSAGAWARTVMPLGPSWAVEIGLGGNLDAFGQTGGQPCYEIDGLIAFSATARGA